MTTKQKEFFVFACIAAGLLFVANVLSVTGALTGHAGRPHWIAGYILITLSWAALLVAVLASHLIVKRR